MREVLILSGKGGTGKTSLTAAFAALAEKPVICDLDVDAPDLHLLLRPETIEEHDFYSGHLAVVDPDKCTSCGDCEDRCRYGAVSLNGAGAVVDPIRCEGCGVCVHFCPAEAIDFPENHCGWWRRSRTRFGSMVHARLFPGEENSGKLVTLLKQKAAETAKEEGAKLVLSDGAPGIGCPVISSISGASLAVVVTEPTVSGMHDLIRVHDLCLHFRLPAMVVVNKWDIDPGQTERIEAECGKREIGLAGRIPFDRGVVDSLVRGEVIGEGGEGPIEEVRAAWERIAARAGA